MRSTGCQGVGVRRAEEQPVEENLIRVRRVLGRIKRGAQEEGFTLLEMVVAVSILAIMTALVAPHVFGIDKHVQTVARDENEKTIEAALNEYYLLYHQYPSGDSAQQLQALKDAQLLQSIPQDPAGGQYVIHIQTDGSVEVTYQDDTGSSSGGTAG
ncbi:competence type IV pilus major pilin ComGC [Alicyclobacillus herbarius]|uniref:competence type IV pilus major pilin ComGC n=1 Tax=Alicyclobacillus herbarius TaxID=122960 RepID=UPI0012DF3448|nr:prepilin-type N-terminal cleavage/methylation domain-containing protein [Alicyclobacillus herbarius]